MTDFIKWEDLKPEIDAALSTTTVEYAVFNDPDYWNPLFESGEIAETQRFQIEQALYTSLSLWHAYRYAMTANADRAKQDKAGKYGLLLVRKRTVVETPWTNVTYEEIDDVRRG